MLSICNIQVQCYGQIIGVVAGRTEAAAKEAARLVKVQYKALTPILTIEVK